MAYHSALLRTYYGAGDYSRATALAQAGMAFRGRARAAPFRGGARGRALLMTRGAYQAGGFFSAIGGALKKLAAPALSIASSFIPGGGLLAKAVSVGASMLGGKKGGAQPTFAAKGAGLGSKILGALSAAETATARYIGGSGLADLTEKYPLGQAVAENLLGAKPKRKRRRRARARYTRRRLRAAPRRRRRRAAPRGDARDASGRWLHGFRAGPYPHRGHSHRRDVAPQYSRRRRRRGGGRRVSFRTADGRQVSFTRR